MNDIVKVENLNKAYRKFALEDVSFAIPEDCITGFIGVNGAGKTTTLRSMLGLTNKDSGTIRFFGEELENNEREIKNRLGIVLDNASFYDELSLNEMKSIIAPAYSEWCEADYKRYLEKFSLNPKQQIKTLSKGMRMKYALALALSHKAEFLIMDEPTSGLDPLIRSQLLKILTEYMEQGGRGVLFSTHITSDLDKIADTLIMIDQGRIVFQEEKDVLLETYRLVKGDPKELNETTEKLFVSLEKTAFSFTGITNQVPEIRKLMPDVMIERASIEDIMLANVKGGMNHAAASY